MMKWSFQSMFLVFDSMNEYHNVPYQIKYIYAASEL